MRVLAIVPSPVRYVVFYVHSVADVYDVHQGQLLPEPLCYTGDILHCVSSYEVYLLLVNIWTYVKVLYVVCITVATFDNSLHC